MTPAPHAALLRLLREAAGGRPLGLAGVEVLLHLAHNGPLDRAQLMELSGLASGALTRAVRPFLPWWEPDLGRERLPRLPLLTRKRKPGGQHAHRYYLSRNARALLDRCGIPWNPAHTATNADL